MTAPPTYSEDGEGMWNGDEWIPAPPGRGPPPPPLKKKVRLGKHARRRKKFLNYFAIFTILIVIIAGTRALSSDKYNLEYSYANAHILIYSIEVDNGEDNRLFEVDVYYDALNRNEFQTGYECDALEYYSSPRTYYLDEFCTIYFADPFVDEVTFGACAQYVASERYYDIHTGTAANPSCVKGQGAILNPKIEPSDGLEESCTSQGELVGDDLRSAKIVSWSGLDDGDSNAYNAEITFSLSFTLYYECK